ncbi:peptidase family M13 [Dictyocaulus viviparus]|uniref:Peptidase family M13 n=1 Tax=Dictyocaulus viviparus TaxID=29172 RepID=A0A0D8Y8S3_DICVI|nr:peptidase family M13 [Dictyocaulus viviparus]
MENDDRSQYDKDGNLHNWWSSRSLKSFDERRRCIVEQYGNYTVPKTIFKVNGKLTQGENIADNGGVKEALKAYQKYVAHHGEEPRLPGLQQFTNTQIFFLSYAHRILAIIEHSELNYTDIVKRISRLVQKIFKGLLLRIVVKAKNGARERMIRSIRRNEAFTIGMNFWCGQKKEAAAMQQVTTDEHSPEVFRVTGVLSNLHEFAEAFSCPSGSALNPTHSRAAETKSGNS